MVGWDIWAKRFVHMKEVHSPDEMVSVNILPYCLFLLLSLSIYKNTAPHCIHYSIIFQETKINTSKATWFICYHWTHQHNTPARVYHSTEIMWSYCPFVPWLAVNVLSQYRYYHDWLKFTIPALGIMHQPIRGNLLILAGEISLLSKI